MTIVGLHSGHDCSFCFLDDEGRPVVHAEYERYIREKEPKGNSPGFFKERFPEVYNGVKDVVACFPMSNFDSHRDSFEEIKQIAENNGGGFHLIGHHQAHAANAFFSSNFEKSIIITMDGGGFEEQDHNKFTAFTVWAGEGNKIEPLLINDSNNLLSGINVGGVWTRTTRYIFNLQSGWPRGHQAGTVMAMAALGDPDKYKQDFLDMFEFHNKVATFKPQGHVVGANVGTDPPHPYLYKWKVKAEQSEQETFDLAAGLQEATLIYVKGLFDQILSQLPDYKNLCLSGGVFLNSVCTGKILEWYDERIDGVFVTPTPHDGGLTLGACQYLYHQVQDKPRVKWNDHFPVYMGEIYSHDDVKSALDKKKDKIKTQEAKIEDIVNLLDDQKIVSVFSKGSESGRRALGNRSILADPRSPDMKDMINEKVKHRQWFRPFAPSILAEDTKDWFEKDVESPYMSFVVKFKEEVRNKVPAVVHFDGSARLQTVTKNNNPFYYELLKKWKEKSGVPILLNTSFNDREPICETPDHAIDCFLRTNIDYLYFDDFNILVSKS